MAKVWLYCLLLLFFLSGKMAQAQSVALGTGVEYDFKAKGLGVNLRGIWNMSYHLNIAGEFDYLPQVDVTDNGSASAIAVQCNLRYRFDLREKWIAYPLLGIRWKRQAEKTVTLNESSKNIKTFPGINLGIGLGYDYGKITPYAEYCYSTAMSGSSIITIGFLIKDVLGGF